MSESEPAYQASLGDDFGVDLADRRRRARRILDRHNPDETHGGLITPETVARRVLHFPTSRAADHLGWAENEVCTVLADTDQETSS